MTVALNQNTRARRVTIKVTKEDIDLSKRSSSSHCMIADAIRYSVKNAIHPSVDIQTIRFSDPKTGLRYTYLTPPNAQRAILAFDEGKPVAPFRVVLRAGQVTEMRHYNDTAKKKMRLNWKKKKHVYERNQQRVRKMLTNEDRKGSVPTIVGGKPPKTTHVGRRRAFGLRSIVQK